MADKLPFSDGSPPEREGVAPSNTLHNTPICRRAVGGADLDQVSPAQISQHHEGPFTTHLESKDVEFGNSATFLKLYLDYKYSWHQSLLQSGVLLFTALPTPTSSLCCSCFVDLSIASA